jgi:hypothetical protein
MHFHAVEKAFHNDDGSCLGPGCPMQIEQASDLANPGGTR